MILIGDSEPGSNEIEGRRHDMAPDIKHKENVGVQCSSGVLGV